ncbi:hypothetical protein BC829DRAFT_421689 [Chytridium lagenaria]|nr:hypothetical protein BC829DRAFT_421689 [Chytridium lagenaria]
MDLTRQHQQEIVDYLKFVRAQRTQTIRELTCTVEEVSELRLSDTTYSQDEVKAIVDDLEAALKSAVDCELMHHSHRHILLLQQYFSQGEKKDGSAPRPVNAKTETKVEVKNAPLDRRNDDVIQELKVERTQN